MKYVITFLLILFSICTGFVPANADPLFDTVMTQVRADQSGLWSMIRTSYDFNADGSVKSKKQAQFDATRQENEHWTLTSVDGHAPDEKGIKAFRTLFRDNPFPPTYGSIANFINSDPERMSEAGGLVKYHIKTLPARTTLIRGHDLSEYLSGEITVDQSGAHPYIKELRIYAATAFKPIIGVKVDHLERVMHYGLTAQGQPVMIESLSSGDGNAFFVPIRIHAQSFFAGHKEHTLVASRNGSSQHH